MASDTLKLKLPKGFVLDKEPNLPSGFVLDKPSTYTQMPSALDENTQLELINQLEGRLPLNVLRPGGRVYQPTARDILTQKQREQEPKRGRAYNQLIKSGITREQIETILDIQKRTKPGIIEQMKRTFGEDIGGIAGGIAGAKLALMLGQAGPQAAIAEEFLTVPLFAAGGAFLGGGAGGAIQDTISPYDDPSLRTFMRSGARQALYELGGREITALARTTPLFKKPLQKSQDVAELFARKGGFFTPKQRDRRILVRASEELSRGSFGGGAIFEGFDKVQQHQALEVAMEVINNLADDAVKDPKTLGDTLVDIFVRKGEKAVKFRGQRQALLDDFFDTLYSHLKTLAPEHKISTEPIRKFAQEVLERDKRLGGALLTGAGKTRMEKITKTLEPMLDFDEFRTIRSTYIKDARQFRVDADKSEAIFAQLAGISDDALFSPVAESGLGEEARTFLRNINAVYGPSKELFEDVFVRRVINRLSESPTNVIKTVFKDYDPERLRRIREILVSPVRQKTGGTTTEKSIAQELRFLRGKLKDIPGGERATQLLSKNAAEGRALWKQLNAVWFREQIMDAWNPTTEILDVKKLDKVFKKIPPETFRMMFPGAKGKAVKDVVKLFETLTPGRRGFVSMFGKTFEIGGLTGIGPSLAAGSGIAATSSFTLAISPTAFAALATNPKATNLLTLGFKAKRGSIKVAPIAARLINILNEDALNDQKAILRERRAKKAKETKRKKPFTGELRGYGWRGF